jgi:hypothetical protein
MSGANQGDRAMMLRPALGPVLASLAIALGAGAAFADADCPVAAKDTWMPEAAMKQKIADMGYTHDVFKVSGNCYEIYGKNKDGKEVEVYFNPVDGSIVKEEVEDRD